MYKVFNVITVTHVAVKIKGSTNPLNKICKLKLPESQR
jgi:hypothetical protein